MDAKILRKQVVRACRGPPGSFAAEQMPADKRRPDDMRLDIWMLDGGVHRSLHKHIIGPFTRAVRPVHRSVYKPAQDLPSSRVSPSRTVPTSSPISTNLQDYQ